ncbi:toxin-antitoxin system protein [Glycomyces xiaoerkulensis]|uniref:toxin-antitoxin system protein n=1 Tax=Glycomyces xiaoerkulensis TaxID=2038139 RepID=UPI000C25FCB2|nr:toxin-antitoxin system protein [Glycomyces xiaoerkulensis]
MTTIKVTTDLRDRIARLAESRHLTMAGAVERAIDVGEEEEFWARARAVMGTAAARADLRRENERFATVLEDELEPEDWSDLL